MYDEIILDTYIFYIGHGCPVQFKSIFELNFVYNGEVGYVIQKWTDLVVQWSWDIFDLIKSKKSSSSAGCIRFLILDSRHGSPLSAYRSLLCLYLLFVQFSSFNGPIKSTLICCNLWYASYCEIHWNLIRKHLWHQSISIIHIFFHFRFILFIFLPLFLSVSYKTEMSFHYVEMVNCARQFSAPWI